MAFRHRDSVTSSIPATALVRPSLRSLVREQSTGHEPALSLIVALLAVSATGRYLRSPRNIDKRARRATFGAWSGSFLDINT